ncbi:MAG: esterase [Cyclobacteriaceae bacterium]|jgi:esterase
MTLFYRTLGDDHAENVPLLILHGVFGSSDNWQTLGKEFAKTRKVYLIDQRNHGNSGHSEAFTYESMAEDLKELMDKEQLQKADVLGHSMGGKTAMFFSTTYNHLVKKLIVVDIAPRNYPPHHQTIFEGFHSVKLDQLNARSDADKQMSTVISHPGIRQFLLKNLTRNEDSSFEWKHNLSVMEDNISNIGLKLPEDRLFEGPVLFIAGGKSDYIGPNDHAEIKGHFPNAGIMTIEGAGHWVHAEKPAELYQTIEQFLT